MVVGFTGRQVPRRHRSTRRTRLDHDRRGREQHQRQGAAPGRPGRRHAAPAAARPTPAPRIRTPAPGAGTGDDPQRPAADRDPRGHHAAVGSDQVRPARRLHLPGAPRSARTSATRSPATSFPPTPSSRSPRPASRSRPSSMTTASSCRSSSRPSSPNRPRPLARLPPAGPRAPPHATRWAGEPPAHRHRISIGSTAAHPLEIGTDPLMADQIRVLIVDDIPETRDHLSKLLGFEPDIEVVGAAASGREAIEMASQLAPDVVLMDINMPDMDGIAATERLSAEVPVRGRRDDVRPGRGGLPPPLDARRGARVPRQAVQLRRAHLLDPPGLHAGAREAVADRRAAGRRRSRHAGAPGDGRRARARRARPRRRGVRPEGRRRPHDARGQPRGRRGHRARPEDMPRRRVVPVR